MSVSFVTDLFFVNLLIFIIGSCILIKGSDLFVDAAAAIARYWHVSELVIGLTLVSIGTSIPELATSAFAQMTNGDSDFVIGNVAGSNVTNITLILGVALALGGTMSFSKQLFTRDVAFMNGLFLVTVLLFLAGPSVTAQTGSGTVPGLHWIFGLLFLAGTFVYSWLLFKAPDGSQPEDDDTDAAPGSVSLVREFAILICGLVMIAAGSKAMVDTVQWGAAQLGISTLIISATIVAFGTSVPELAVTVAGILKKKADMAIGNIVGSCTFNILLIFGAAAVIRPLGINSGAGGITTLVLMIPSGLLLLLFMGLGRKTMTIGRLAGFIFLLLYAGFLGFNVWTAMD